MKQDTDDALDNFAKLYYFVRPIRMRMTIGKASITIGEQIAAILWLLKMIQDEGDSSQQRLCKLVSTPYPSLRPSGFSRALAEIYGMGLIVGRTDLTNKRRNILRLTAKGEKVVREIKAQRSQLLDDILEELSASDREALLSALSHVSRRIWDKKTEKVSEKRSGKREISTRHR